MAPAAQEQVPAATSLQESSMGKDKPREKALDAQANAVMAELQQTTPPITATWTGTLCWSGFIVLWYLMLQRALRMVVPSSDAARTELFNQVPPLVYHYSEAAFFVATMLNVLNLVFEDSGGKQQLAMLSAIIKGLSWHSDHLITAGTAVVKFDRHGALLLPSRYVQWSCSTPTMIFTMSRISSLAPAEVAATMLADWAMVVCGYLSAELPWALAVLPLAASYFCFMFVMKRLHRILTEALNEAPTPHARACLRFTLGSTIAIWNLFWVAWVLGHCGVPSLAALGEPLTIFANFAAKVIFSTSIVYNNFMTLAQRRHAAQVAQEHKERIQAVRDLTAAVSRKDAFLEVVGHELRTPLNAIVQLSAALAVGAGGAMSVQAREWLSTIKASASHLLGVVHDILTFRATQATSVQLQQELVNVGEVVDEVLRQLLPGAGPNITLEKVVHARLPPIVADRRRLVLALSNLVANAIKFMDKPSGRVTVKAYPDRGARNVVIKVVDNGPGLSSTQLAMLAAPSAGQLEGAGRRAGGLGLGIPITHQLAVAHGGVLRLSSPGRGAGTTAMLRLPVLQAQTEARLRMEFCAAYQALGYSLEQLLSPEVAASEGRACPTFSDTVTTYANTSIAVLPATLVKPYPPSSAASVASSTSLQRLEVVRQPETLPAAAVRAGSLYTTPGTKPSAAGSGIVAGGGGPSSSSSSMDLGSSAIMQSFHWPPIQPSGPSASHPPTPPGSLPAAAAGCLDLSRDDGSHQTVATRPSEDSLAAWEAYAEQMGYTVPSGTGLCGDPSGCSSPRFDAMQDRGSGGLGSHATAAGTPQGVPGSAVALMSALYVPTDPLPVQRGGSATSASPRKLHLRNSVLGSFKSTSARESIEEVDEEGLDDADASEVRRVTTPRRAMPRAGTRASDVSANEDVATEALLAAAAQATQVVHIAAQNLSTTVQELEARSAAMLEADAKAAQVARQQHRIPEIAAAGPAAAPPLAREPSDWEAYIALGGQGVATRVDDPAVVADAVRMSRQYDAAAAAAAAAGRPLDSQWQSWVSRVPEHHRAPGGGGGGGH